MTRRYPAYRDSGVRWLGQIPERWETRRFKTVLQEREERSESGAEVLLSVSAYTGVTPRSENIDDGDFISRAESLEGYKVCYSNDLVMNIMLAWNRAQGVSAYGGIVSPAYAVFELAPVIHPPYLNYLVRSNEYCLYFKAHSAGVIDSRLRLYPDQFGALHCIFPPLPEQTAIAAFLDRETAKIDALVAEQRRLIDLLKEKRQAVISHAVTRGLNPAAKLKPTGVEWLGDVPEGWAFGKLGHFAWLQGGFAFPSDAFGSEGVAVVKMTNLDRGSIAFENAAYIPEDAALERVALKEGDLVWGMSGSVGETGSLGNFARVRLEDLPCQLNQRVGRFVPLTNAIILDFLAFIIQSRNFYEQVLLWVTGTAQFNISSEQVQSCRIAVPPRAEQEEIVAFLKQTLGVFDTLAQTAESAITLLQERRAALISAAVTGKIDVRDLVPNQTEAA